jgi:hypothetical protein
VLYRHWHELRSRRHRKLFRRYPRIIFPVLAGEPSMAYRALEERNVDLAIVRVIGPISDEHRRHRRG